MLQTGRDFIKIKIRIANNEVKSKIDKCMIIRYL